MKIADLDLTSRETFCLHPWVRDLEPLYEHDATLARYATARALGDLKRLGEERSAKDGRFCIVATDGRVKSKESFFNKLYMKVRCSKRAVTQATLRSLYGSIRDLSGIRFSCPYFDQVIPVIEEFVRPELAALGYGTDLLTVPGCDDKNYLDQGDDFGYRSYHFFIEIPTLVDIFGAAESCLCEVQARTELQHVWAVKSHDLLYKKNGRKQDDPHCIDDMRQVSNSLRAADQFLVSIRDRVNGGNN